MDRIFKFVFPLADCTATHCNQADPTAVLFFAVAVCGCESVFKSEKQRKDTHGEGGGGGTVFYHISEHV